MCYKTVIPALFPYMVISSLIVSSGLACFIGRAVRVPFTYLFAIDGNGAAAFFIGLAAGFPVGAKTSASLYREGLCEKEEAQRLCAFCNNTGPAFVIAGVGSLLCDYMLGVAIYIIEVISALILGVILSIGKPRKREYSRRVVKFNPDLTAGVRDALSGTLSVCEFVIFFSVLNKCILSVASPILSSKYFSALFCALLEVTSGVSTGAVLGGRAAFVLCAFAVGWSGLCVHTQTAAFLIPSGLSVKKYIFQKACYALICTALALLYSLFL